MLRLTMKNATGGEPHHVFLWYKLTQFVRERSGSSLAAIPSPMDFTHLIV